jgi:type II secretory pathway component PulF
LARYHQDASLRRKLLFVRNEVEQGASLWPTLQRVKLLTAAEVALVQSAEKVGNCAWAMAQLAMLKRRRVRRRLEFLGQLLHPAAVLVLGGVVFAMFLSVFVPLTKMILSSA